MASTPQAARTGHHPAPLHLCEGCGDEKIPITHPFCDSCADAMQFEYLARVRAERDARVAHLLAEAERAAGMDDGGWGCR